MSCWESTRHAPPCSTPRSTTRWSALINWTLADELAKYCSSDQQHWDLWLLFILMMYQSAKQKAAGYTPAPIMFGREIQLPLDQASGRPPGEELPKRAPGVAAADGGLAATGVEQSSPRGASKPRSAGTTCLPGMPSMRWGTPSGSTIPARNRASLRTTGKARTPFCNDSRPSPISWAMAPVGSRPFCPHQPSVGCHGGRALHVGPAGKYFVATQ